MILYKTDHSSFFTELGTIPSITTLQVGPGTEMESISVSTSKIIRVDIGNHNFFCVDGITKGEKMLPMWRIGNTSVQAVSLYQLNISQSILSEVNQCISCNCVGTLFRAKFLHSLLENPRTYGTFDVSAFVVFGYSGSPADIKHYRCSMVHNLFMSFMVVSDIGRGVMDLEFAITTIKNRPAIRNYTVEFGKYRHSTNY